MSFLKDKVALITGAGRVVLSNGQSGSIGYGIATAYAKEGANLVITGRPGGTGEGIRNTESGFCRWLPTSTPTQTTRQSCKTSSTRPSRNSANWTS